MTALLKGLEITVACMLFFIGALQYVDNVGNFLSKTLAHLSLYLSF